MATVRLEMTVQGTDRAEMEEGAWAIAGLYYGDDEYEIVSSSDARYVNALNDYSVSYNAGPSGFEADFIFKAVL